MTLLEAWFLHSNQEILGEHRDPSSSIIRVAGFVRQIPDKGLKIAGNQRVEEQLHYTIGMVNLALLSLFGLIILEQGKTKPLEGWKIARIERTPFGNALLKYLYQIQYVKMDSMEILDRIVSLNSIEFGEWQKSLQQYFPEWRNNLVLPKHEFRDGSYIFKVSIDRDIWRQIAIPAKKNLDELGSLILDAFDFDYDHLYRFLYKDRFGLIAEINHPEMDDLPNTDSVCIGDIPLQMGEMMIFNYDFGDDWEFAVLLERIDPLDSKNKKPKLLASHGKAPQQYPGWDDDDDDDDFDEEEEEDEE